MRTSQIKGRFFIGYLVIVLTLSLTLTVSFYGCLGKTVARQIYFISPKKKTVYIAPPVNYTDRYLLDEQVRARLKDFFSSQTRFGIVEDVDNSDLYVLIHIHNYQAKDVNDYGFGNREIIIQSKLFVSDSKYINQSKNNEQLGRYYYKGYPLVVEVLDYVEIGDSSLTEEYIENLAIDKVAVTVHELMLNGKLPTKNQIIK